ncbi:hypothetical protein U1Q18_034917 [Sarracenia purpurea var. burkii]
MAVSERRLRHHRTIYRVKEGEEPIDPSIARAYIVEPWRLLSVDSSSVLKRVKEVFGIGDDRVNVFRRV